MIGVSAPAYKIVTYNESGEIDITSTINDRLISLTLSDYRGFETDTLELCLDDADGKLEMPSTNVKLTLWLGWRGEPLVDKGDFIVAGITSSGAPDTITIRARSADFKGSMMIRYDKSYHKTTIGDIVKSIAAKNSLECAIASKLANIEITHIDQTESDTNFLTRLASENGAIVTIKKSKILFMEPGRVMSATGQPLPIFTITRNQGDNHNYAIDDRDEYTAVIANYLDTKTKKTLSVTYNGSDKDKKVTDDDNIFVLRHKYATKQNAFRAAKSKFEQLQRGVATFSIDLADARPDLFPEVQVAVSGFKKQIDNEQWIIKSIQHKLSNSGFTSSLELEGKMD